MVVQLFRPGAADETYDLSWRSGMDGPWNAWIAAAGGEAVVADRIAKVRLQHALQTRILRGASLSVSAVHPSEICT